VRDLEKRGGKLPVGEMIAHRYIRITPAFAAVLVFYSEIASRVGDGPFFVRQGLTLVTLTALSPFVAGCRRLLPFVAGCPRTH